MNTGGTNYIEKAGELMNAFAILLGVKTENLQIIIKYFLFLPNNFYNIQWILGSNVWDTEIIGNTLGERQILKEIILCAHTQVRCFSDIFLSYAYSSQFSPLIKVF